MFRIILALYLALCGVANAQLAGGLQFPGPGTAHTTAGGCSQATAFLARTSGLSGTETAAYTTFICGLVTDGVFAKFDVLYVFATNTTTTAKLNLVGNVLNGTDVSGSSLHFDADQGYTPNDIFSGIDTGLVPSAGGFQYTLNSGGIGVCVLNNRTTNENSYAIGAQAASTLSVLQLLNGGLALFDINEANFPQTASTTSQGSWFANRTGASAMALYRNGSLLATDTGTATSVPNFSLYVMVLNNQGSILNGSTDQFAAAWIGGGFTATDVSNFRTRLNAYMTAVNGSGC